MKETIFYIFDDDRNLRLDWIKMRVANSNTTYY